MYALPLALPQYEGVRMTGEVAYPTHTVPVPAESLTDQFVQDLGSLIRRLADERPVNRTPSADGMSILRHQRRGLPGTDAA